MTSIETKSVRHPVCECGCCGPAGTTAVMEPPQPEVKEAVSAEDATCRCDCGCSANAGEGCECGCTDKGCECGCGASSS